RRRARTRSVGGAVRRGLGVAVVEQHATAAAAAATLSRNEDGSVTLRVGASGVPTGVAPRLVAVAAEALGVEASRIAVVPADTDSAAAEEGKDSPEPYLVARAVARAAVALRERLSFRAAAASSHAEASATAEAGEFDTAFGGVFAEVQVDTETGVVRVR